VLVSTERANELVLACAQRMPAPVLRDVRAACEKAALDLRMWSAGEPRSTVRRAPLLLIGALPAFARAIPDELMGPVTSTFPGLPLLLLCEETLMRPSMALQRGRVSLLGPPLSSARIHARIEALVVDQRAPPSRPTTLPMGLDPGRPPVLTREDERPLWWTAVVTCPGPSPRVDAARAGLRHHTATGLIAVIPFPERPGVSPSLLDLGDIEAVFAATMDLDQDAYRRRILSESVGESAGIVHLGRAADEWFIYWPRPDAPLTIASRSRLPQRWDLQRNLSATDGRAVRLPAVSGDLVVALSAPLPRDADDTVDLARIMLHGGPATLQHVEARLRAAQTPLLGALTEIL
jgi:hypothetical protein